jgi:hypothetical protein
MNLKIVPFLAWFAIGIGGTYVTTQLRPVMGSEIATNLALFIFLLGGIAAYNISERLRLCAKAYLHGPPPYS